jgi:predicted transposase/invertase (TIGR01784 family)
MAKKHIRFDWAAKKLLRDKANFDILEGFLSELLKEDIKIEGLLESEGNQDDENDKFNRVDLYAETANHEHIIIEIQNTRELDYLMRMLYATSKSVVEHIDLGQSYAHIKKIIAISIVYFDLGKGDDYIYKAETTFKGIHTNTVLQLTRAQQKLLKQPTIPKAYPEYYLIQTEKFNNVINDTLDEWIYFFKNSEVQDNFTAKGMEVVKEKLKVMNMTDKEQKQYQWYLERLSSEASYAETMKIEAEEKVREAEEKAREVEEKVREDERKKTEKKERQETALRAIKKGFSNEDISDLTGLSETEIEALRQDIR